MKYKRFNVLEEDANKKQFEEQLKDVLHPLEASDNFIKHSYVGLEQFSVEKTTYFLSV